MLLEYSTDNLLEAIEGKQLTTSQMEGVARLFAGWDFRENREVDLQRLSADLKRKLLQHCEQSDDNENVTRARHTFGEKNPSPSDPRYRLTIPHTFRK